MKPGSSQPKHLTSSAGTYFAIHREARLLQGDQTAGDTSMCYSNTPTAFAVEFTVAFDGDIAVASQQIGFCMFLLFPFFNHKS